MPLAKTQAAQSVGRFPALARSKGLSRLNPEAGITCFDLPLHLDKPPDSVAGALGYGPTNAPQGTPHPGEGARPVRTWYFPGAAYLDSSPFPCLSKHSRATPNAVKRAVPGAPYLCDTCLLEEAENGRQILHD
jgi:hypothetical protein